MKNFLIFLVPMSFILLGCDDGLEDPHYYYYYYPDSNNLYTPPKVTIPKYDFTKFKASEPVNKKTYSEEEKSTAKHYLTELTTEENRLKETYGVEYRATSKSELDFSTLTTFHSIKNTWEFTSAIFLPEDNLLQEKFPDQDLTEIKLKMFNDLWSHALSYEDLEKYGDILKSESESFQTYGKMSSKLEATGKLIGNKKLATGSLTAIEEILSFQKTGITQKNIFSQGNFKEILVTKTDVDNPFQRLEDSLNTQIDTCEDYTAIIPHVESFQLNLSQSDMLKKYCSDPLIPTLLRIFANDDLSKMTFDQLKSKVGRYNQALAQYAFNTSLESLKLNGFDINESTLTSSLEARKTWEKNQFEPYVAKVESNSFWSKNELGKEFLTSNFNHAIAENGNNNLSFYIEATKHLIMYTKDSKAQLQLIHQLDASQKILDKYKPSKTEGQNQTNLLQFEQIKIGTNPYEQTPDSDKVFEIMNSFM